MNARYLQRFLPCVVAGVLVLVLKCTQPSSPEAGNISQTGNGRVAGILYASDGKTPARNAVVAIRPRNSLADTSRLGLGKRFADTSTVTTDDSGKFEFDSTLDTGLYVIEANQDDTGFAIIDSVQVTGDDSIVEVADTLKPAGAIKGVIRLPEGGDPRKVFVLAFGIDRFASVDSLGAFRFQNLAEAAYDLRIISSLDDYGVLDLRGVAVVSADTMDLDTLELPFEGIPTPKGLALTYDTLRQIVTLTWNQADTALVTGYNIYRQHQDSGLVKLNAAPITDTTYGDSTALQDQTYSYQVKALDKNGNEGLLSLGAAVDIVPAVQEIGSFGGPGNADGQFQNPTGLAYSGDFRVLIADVQNHRIQQFDLQGNFISSFGAYGADSGQFNIPIDIAVDDSGNVYVADQENDRIQKFDASFNVVAVCDSGLERPNAIALDSHGNLYVNEMAVPKIKKLNSQLEFVLEWGRGGSNDSDAIGLPRALEVDSLDRVYVLEGSIGKVVVFDTSGNFVKTIWKDASGNSHFVNPRNMTIGDQILYIADQMQIHAFDSAGNFVTKWGNNNFYDILALPDGQIWASVLSEQKVYRFQM